MDRIEGICNLCQNPIRKRVADGLWEDDESMTVCGSNNARHVLAPLTPPDLTTIEDDEDEPHSFMGYYGFG